MPRHSLTRSAAPFVALLGLTACGDSPTGPRGPALRLVAGDSLVDTVLAQPLQALVVEVRDERGALKPGTVVRFTAGTGEPTSPDRARIFVCSLAAAACGSDQGGAPVGTPVVDAADSAGRAQAVIRLGSVAGAAVVWIEVPEFGIRDSAVYRVTPGAATQIRLPVRDTALYQGNSYELGSVVTDRFGNARSDSIAFAIAGPMSASVSSVGRVTANGFGRTAIVVRSAGIVDTARVTVTPRGALVAVDSGPAGKAIALIELDGSGYRRMADMLPAFEGAWPSWAPNGREFAFARGGGGSASYHGAAIAVGDATGAVRTLITVAPRPGRELHGRFGASGAYVYLSALDTLSVYRIWRVRAEGGVGGERVTPAPTSAYAPDDDFHPSESPDGTRIVARRVGADGTGALVVYTLATGAVLQLGVDGIAPRWSPAGDQIVYTRGGAIRVIQPDGQGSRLVNQDLRRRYADGVEWSPDGRWLLARADAGVVDGAQQAAQYFILDPRMISGPPTPHPLRPSLAQPSWKP